MEKSRMMLTLSKLAQTAMEKVSARIAVSEAARATLIKHVGGDALDHVATATHARQPRRMKPHLVVAFQAADSIEKPLGVDPGVGDHRVCGEPPHLAGGTNLFKSRKHDPRDGRSAGGVGHLSRGKPVGPGWHSAGAETRTKMLQEFGCHEVALSGSL
jgi:hypothetical protein